MITLPQTTTLNSRSVYIYERKKYIFRAHGLSCYLLTVKDQGKLGKLLYLCHFHLLYFTHARTKKITFIRNVLMKFEMNQQSISHASPYFKANVYITREMVKSGKVLRKKKPLKKKRFGEPRCICVLA